MDTLTCRILTRHDTELIDTIDIDTPWHATFGTWHAKSLVSNSWKYFSPMYPLAEGMSKIGTKFLKMLCTQVPTSWRHVTNLGPDSWKYCDVFSKSIFPKKSWHGMAWNIHDTPWHAKIWHGTACQNMAWHVEPWHGMARGHPAHNNRGAPLSFPPPVDCRR